TGFVGSHLLEHLSSQGIAARCLLRPTAKPRRLPLGIEPALGELAAGTGLEAALEGVDTVIHVAGVTRALSPADYYRGNVEATRRLGKALRGKTVRLVHVSSLAAMGPG